MSRVAGAMAAAAVLLAASTPAAAQPAAKPDLTDWKIEQTRTTRAVAVAREVRIENPWGNVTLRAGDSDEIIISAVSQRHRQDPREARVQLEEIDSGFSVEVRFDDSVEVRFDDSVEVRFDDSVEVKGTADWQRRRIDLGVLVPATLAVSIRTGDADIEVRDLEARADLETKAGNIEFRGLGGLSARAESGSIFAQFHRSDWPRPATIETRTGDIRAELLEGAAAKVEIETRGPITSDYSTTIDRTAGSRFKRGVATVGAGGQTLRLRSYSGAVRLLAVIVPERPKASDQASGEPSSTGPSSNTG